MNIAKNIRFTGALTLLGLFGFVGNAAARENIGSSGHRESQQKTTVTGCQPAIAAIDLDINNVRARLMTGGDMWWNIGLQVAAYEVPKNSGRSSQFAASCWIGGVDKTGSLKVAAQTYRQDGNDYWPGALDINGKISSDACANWDNFWKIDKSTINAFIEAAKVGGNLQASQYSVIFDWPGKGNSKAKGANGLLDLTSSTYSGNSYAPFVDLNGNGIYEPAQGEYPDILGDEYIWWVFNDAGNVKLQSQTASMGIEVQTSAFAYSTQDFLNNTTFCNYRVINRGALTIDSTYIAVWDDCDLGYYADDYIGCDTSRGLGIQYNGTNDDGGSAGHPVNSYGLNPPQVGVDFFKGPKRIIHRSGLPDTIQQLGMTNFTYYNNDASVIGNPVNGIQIYNYMTGTIKDGEHFSNDFQGTGVPCKGYGSGPVSHFVFTGDPGDKTSWSECNCNNNPGDRRFIFSSGPFELVPGAINDITFGALWVSGVGGCPSTDFKTIKSVDDGAQALFEEGFKTVEGPEAPRLVVRELDRKLVFYMVNDYGSNNYAESYGRTDGTYIDSLRYHQAVAKAVSNDYADSLYHFEGYRVFQLANSSITSAEIFDPNTGEVDNTKAYEVFQCDIHNNVTKIINYAKVTAVSDSTWTPQIKVVGKDSGVVHSFTISADQFAATADPELINYHTYYFVAIAYGYNNFQNFNPLPHYVNGTQDQPYIGSAHGAGGINIPVVAAIPNPANGNMGTTLNANFGDGVVVTRIEGLGNGGSFTELSTASEMNIVKNDSVSDLVYSQGQGPVNVKVIDPEVLQPVDWVLQIGSDSGLVAGVLPSSATWKLTAIDSKGNQDVIYSERDISSVNEQIIEKYGISVSVAQANAPGVDQVNGNGYISSTISFADNSKSWLWGVADQSDSNFANWIRSGNNQHFGTSYSATNPCNFNDYMKLDTLQFYELMLANFSPAKSTWAPYNLAAAFFAKHYSNGSACAFEVAYTGATQDLAHFSKTPDVNIVFTPDKSLWTRCAVVEEQEDSNLAQNNAMKFTLRKHAGWDMDYASDGVTPVYSSDASENGMSWFPGYAVDINTGIRLNIIFGEDSYLGSDNGGDMIFNPSTNMFNTFDGSIVFGGKHIVYVMNTKYDSDAYVVSKLKNATPLNGNTTIQKAFENVAWVGVPTLNPSVPLASLRDGIIPTETRLQFRVNRPYAAYKADPAQPALAASDSLSGTLPYYTFTTKNMVPSKLSDTTNRSKLLSRIYAVPNPYYGFSGYETNRYDTKVKIINLPQRVTAHIYALDGTLVRTLTKDDATSFLDWDVRNAAGLPIASGMYLIHVQADGIGETVLKWFGAMRPIDATSY